MDAASTAGPRVGPALAGALADGRARYNARAAEARLLGGGFAEGRLVRALTGPVDALATAVAAVDPAALPAVVDAAYDAAIVLTARGLLGGDDARERDPVAACWDALADLAPLVAADPVRTIGALSNATAAVATTAGADVSRWHAGLPRLGQAAVTPDDLLDGGRLLAWTCGLAQHRPAALDAADALAARDRHDVVAVALDLPAHDPAAVRRTTERLADDRWWRPDTDLAPGAVVPGRPAGGFIGLDGPFPTIPRVWVAQDGRLLAGDGGPTSTWWLHADAYGTVLSRTAPVGGGPGHADRWARPADPRPRRSVAATADTLAWTTTWSYRVAVQGRRRP